jgi:hypothetical protein
VASTRQQIPRTPITKALVGFGRTIAKALKSLDPATMRVLERDLATAEQGIGIIEARLRSVEQVADKIGAIGGAFPLSIAVPLPVGAIADPGNDNEASRARHVHEGVHAVNAAVGDLTASGLGLVQTGNAFAFPGFVTITVADTTGSYLGTKLVAGTGITKTVLSPGGNETLEIKTSGPTMPAPLAGHLIYGDAVPAWVILGPGTAGHVLTQGASFPAWAANAAVPTSRLINTTAPITGGGNLSIDRTIEISDFVASGPGHARGAVPDTPLIAGTAKFLREDATWNTPVATASISEVSIPFTDGDTLRRVTVTDAAITAGSKIVGSIRRADTADDSADAGYLYMANVVRVGTGAFDLLVACLDWGFGDPTENPPNETIKFQYTST